VSEKLIIAAIVALFGAGAGAWLTRNHYEGVLAKVGRERTEEQAAATERLRLLMKARDAAAERYEAWKAQAAPRAAASKKETDHAIANDPTRWGAAAVPDGVRAAAEFAARAAADPGQPAPAVPAVAPPGAADEPGAARRLP
jgi:hypothetical protein